MNRAFENARRLAAGNWMLMVAVLLAGVGCSSSGSKLRISSSKADQTYSQQLPLAYASHNADGELDVVLTGDTTAGPEGTGAAGVRQVMHVRVLWRPMSGTKHDHPTATNATIRWYVFGETDRSIEMIEYTGAAFVAVTAKGDVTRFDIQNGSLRPNPRHKGLNDPIGQSRLQGTIFAKQNSRRVNEVLSQVQGAIVAAEAATSTASPREASSHLPVEP